MNTPKKILIVEDDVFFRKPLARILRERGFEVVEASDGKEGIEQLVVLKPDFVVLDIIMPHKNGFEFLEDMAQLGDVSLIPVFIYSNLSQETDRKKAQSLGVDGVMIKTEVSIDDAADRVENFLKMSVIK